MDEVTATSTTGPEHGSQEEKRVWKFAELHISVTGLEPVTFPANRVLYPKYPPSALPEDLSLRSAGGVSENGLSEPEPKLLSGDQRSPAGVEPAVLVEVTVTLHYRRTDHEDRERI